MIKTNLIIILLFCVNIVFSQNSEYLYGFVYEVTEDHHHENGEKHEEGDAHGVKLEKIAFVNLVWKGTKEGAISDENGFFKIKRTASNSLVVSFVSYETVTIKIAPEQDTIQIYLAKDDELLTEVVIDANNPNAYISRIKTIKTEILTEKALQQLPCCNLSESFENSPSVDVGYSDAITGAKHIQMLGLSGIYTQVLTENLPTIRGFASNFGLTYIPGTWMEAIQISKGSASVLNGYESVTGQINVEMRKPDVKNDEHALINLYGNSLGGLEANLFYDYKISKYINSAIMLHSSKNFIKIDKNKDNFLDIPLKDQINIFTRFKYKKNKTGAQFAFRILSDNINGGEKNFDIDKHKLSNELYGNQIKTSRYEAFAKMGFPLDEKSLHTVGFLSHASWQSQDAFFGERKYDNEQKNLFLKAAFRSIINNTKHKLNYGLSFNYDDYYEKLDSATFTREEIVPGIFTEYNFNNLKNLNILLGIRYDNNSHFGSLITPRLHVKYDISKNTTMRASAGKGYRSANIFTDNISLLNSNRRLVFNDDFKIEEAWNYGININKEIKISKISTMNFGVDFYRTDFQNQIVIDKDKNEEEINFYNLKGESYSNSLQIQVSYKRKRLELMAAYKKEDVNTTTNKMLKNKALIKRDKALLTASYATFYDKWQFDFTAQINGESRLPNYIDDDDKLIKGEFSPIFPLFFLQVTKRFKNLDIYAGVENIADYTQEQVIISAESPFDDKFDSSIVYAPILGRKFYLGIRLTL